MGGGCSNCTGKSESENIINLAWMDSKLSQSTTTEYSELLLNLYKAKNFLDVEVQLYFYRKMLYSKKYFYFFEFIIEEITNNFQDKNFRITFIICFLFLTDTSNANDLYENYKKVVNKFSCKEEIENNFDFLSDVIKMYILLISKLSLNALLYVNDLKRENENDLIKREEEVLIDAFNSKNVNILMNDLFFEDKNNYFKSFEEFFEKRYHILNHENIREELLKIYHKLKNKE